MQDPQLNIDTDLVDLDLNAWLGQIDDVGDDLGFFEQLGQHHFACFLEAGNNLLVTFENTETVRQHNTDAEPRGFGYARQDGWSHLALLSTGESWFRDPALFDFFDRLTDDGFFEDFENILFHGAHGGGYAAAAYSVAAPGATVVAIRPQATLNAQITGWDPRYIAERRRDFSSRYGYAPDMIDAADRVFVAYDPTQSLDAIHAMLFRRPNVTMLPCPLLGAQLDHAFDRLGIHDLLIKLAMERKLDRKRFGQLLRARRYDPTYAKSLVTQLLRTNHKGLARIVCQYMLNRRQDAFFEKTLLRLDGKRAA
ncbi:hypothetical protein [Yoonia sp. 2307UL14-13]|uniref:hypothetical protein n=1 Tax=Yoonia sp. 2307UL14-13 TaxID=3126506 RepID=UPI0030A0D2AF